MKAIKRFGKLCLLLLCGLIPSFSMAGDLRFAVLSVGSGDSSVIIFPNNKVMMIDTGVTNETFRTVIPFLQRHGITKIDYFLGTHVHPDHTDGIPVLRNNGFIDAATVVWDWNSFKYKDTFTLEGTSWFIYNARDTAYHGTDANYNSVSYRIEYNGFVYSGSGDEGTKSMTRFMNDFPNLVPAHVRNTEHHGYGPTSSSFLRALKSKLYIVSCSTAVTGESAYKTIGTVAKEVGGVRVLTGTNYNNGRGHVYVRATSGTNWSWKMCSMTETIPGFYAAPSNDAQFVSQTVPATMTPGETAQVSITLKNSGRDSWSTAGGQKLGAQSPQDNMLWTGSSRVDLPAAIASNQNATFTFTITAPTNAGSYAFQWQMVDDSAPNQGWFGSKTPLTTIQVAGAPTVPVVNFLAPSTLTVKQGTNLYVNVSATDPEGISRVYLSKNGVELTRSEGGAPYEWNAAGQADAELMNLQPGSFTLTAKAVDTVGTAGEKSITITVQTTNQPPYFISNPFTMPDATAGTAYSQSLSAKAVDPEGGVKTFSKIAGPAWLSITAGGTAQGTPSSVDVGTNSFMVQVVDPVGLIGSASMLINVKPAPMVTVPSVLGQTEAVARTNITAAGLVVGTVTSNFSSTVPAGVVISQTPVGGTSVAPGSAVSLVVSKGVQMVTVPSVVGQTQAAARTNITAVGLVVGTVTSNYSSTVAAGSVISQTPAGSTTAAIGSSVSLVISLGASPQPNLVLNNSFETNTASWTLKGSAARSTTTAAAGVASLRINTASSSATQMVAIVAGKTYDISVNVNVSARTAGMIVFDTSDKYDAAGQGQFTFSATNGGWKKYSGSFTATNSSVTLRMFSDSSFAGTAYFDLIELKAR